MYDSCKSIKENIVLEILSGGYKPGDKIDSIRVCASKWGINPNTVHKVYKYLQTRGVISTMSGNKTYLTDNIEIIQQLKSEITCFYINNLYKNLSGLKLTEEEVSEIVEKYISGMNTCKE